MTKQYYEKVFSIQRMEKYFDKYPEDEQKAILHYHLNIELSEAFYSCLSMFEVAFRNSLNRELSECFGVDWVLKLETIPGLRNLGKEINIAKRHINNRNETITANKVIAELPLGFWVRLLNVEYELILWKHLRKVFPYMDKGSRQRKKISAPINKIRNFRNRVFHHEPIAWNLYKLSEMHHTIFAVMKWLNVDLPGIALKYDRVAYLIERTKLKI